MRFALALLLVAGCGTSLSAAGKRVVVVEGPWLDQERSFTGQPCVALGEIVVKASSSEVREAVLDPKAKGGTVSGSTATENALVKLRNEAADRGATHVHVADVRTTGEARAEARGHAYKCPSAT